MHWKSKGKQGWKKGRQTLLSALEAAYCEYSWTPKKAAKSLLFYKQQPLTKVNKTNKDKTAFHSTVWSVCQFWSADACTVKCSDFQKLKCIVGHHFKNIGDEPWPTTTLVPSMCFTHMTQGDLAAPFWKFVIQKECKSIKKHISINSYIG